MKTSISAQFSTTETPCAVGLAVILCAIANSRNNVKNGVVGAKNPRNTGEAKTVQSQSSISTVE